MFSLLMMGHDYSKSSLSRAHRGTRHILDMLTYQQLRLTSLEPLAPQEIVGVEVGYDLAGWSCNIPKPLRFSRIEEIVCLLRAAYVDHQTVALRHQALNNIKTAFFLKPKYILNTGYPKPADFSFAKYVSALQNHPIKLAIAGVLNAINDELELVIRSSPTGAVMLQRFSALDLTPMDEIVIPDEGLIQSSKGAIKKARYLSRRTILLGRLLSL